MPGSNKRKTPARWTSTYWPDIRLRELGEEAARGRGWSFGKLVRRALAAYLGLDEDDYR